MLLVISDGIQARLGSLSADRERFQRWRTIEGENHLDPLGNHRDLETLVRGIFDKMPSMMVRKTFQRATQDPAFMAALLRRNVSEKERIAFARSMHSYLLASGLTFATNENFFPEEGQIRQTLERNPPPRSPPPRQAPVAPTTRGVPGLPSGGGAPPAKGGTPPTTQSRTMLQQLFPNDAITGAAAMQGGAPPMPG